MVSDLSLALRLVEAELIECDYWLFVLAVQRMLI